MLFLPLSSLAEAIEVLQSKEIRWAQVPLHDRRCPPPRMLSELSSLDRLACLALAAGHGLVEELLASLKWDWDLDRSHLELLGWELSSRKVAYNLGLTQAGGHKSWTEMWCLPDLFWLHRAYLLENFPRRGVVVKHWMPSL